jgi:hypothetical protein
MTAPPSIRRPKVDEQIKRSESNSPRAGMVLTETPPAGSADARCVKCVGRILSDLYGDDGKKRDLNPIGSSRVRFLPLRLSVAALGRPGAPLCRHCATSLAIRQYVSLNSRQRGSITISESLYRLHRCFHNNRERHGRTRGTNWAMLDTPIQRIVEPRRDRYELFLRPNFTLVLPNPLSLVVGYSKQISRA